MIKYLYPKNHNGLKGQSSLPLSSLSWLHQMRTSDYDISVSVIELQFEAQYSFTSRELVEVIYGDDTGSSKHGLFGDGNIENCFQKFPQEHQCNKFYEWLGLESLVDQAE